MSGRPDWQSEYNKLMEKHCYMEKNYCETVEQLNKEIEMLEQKLEVYRNKWSVIELIFGKGR